MPFGPMAQNFSRRSKPCDPATERVSASAELNVPAGTRVLVISKSSLRAEAPRFSHRDATPLNAIMRR